jgi:membrane protease YdiL (CAAX protease family)
LLAVAVFAYAASDAFSGWVGLTAAQSSSVNRWSGDGICPSWGLILLFSAESAVFEETIVRAYAITRMVDDLGWSRARAVTVSVLLQASYHTAYGFPTTGKLLAIFLVFSVFFVRWRNAVTVIMAHFWIDLISLRSQC